MFKPHSYKAEALVLRRARVGEADLLLTLFTPTEGKVRAMARGAVRPGSKLGGHLDMLMRSSLLLALPRSGGTDIVAQAHTIHSYLPLRHSLEDIGRGLYLAELVDRFLPERLSQPQVYFLLLHALHRLVAGDGDAVVRHFEAQLLGLLGYRPELYHCLACHARLGRGTAFFSPASGGLFCVRCRSQDAVSRPVSEAAQRALRSLLEQGLEVRLTLTSELIEELRGLLRSYISCLLERDVSSARFLDSVRRPVAESPRA
ncbi:MAG: DNA repair protein RecO [Chloroflexi bacterium]|nr:DNA repair protein RecO [Chloroflexota bacterium]